MNDTMTKRDHIAAMMMASVGRELLEADTHIPDRDMHASRLSFQIRREANACEEDAMYHAARWAYDVADALIHASKVAHV